eukprot:5313395-Pleurochrysis_carterae.AAC.1
MAVRISRFCRLRLSENSELCSTIFSSSSMSSLGRSAVMKALTVVDTTSGFFVSGSAFCGRKAGAEGEKRRGAGRHWRGDDGRVEQERMVVATVSCAGASLRACEG